MKDAVWRWSYIFQYTIIFLKIERSNINDVIRAVLNSLFFFRKDLVRTKSAKKQ